MTFTQGDATHLPFADATFDIVWTQHVAMNIENKSALYQSIHRVLKEGGRFALYDPIKGNGLPVIYPTPWARLENISFLLTEGELKQTLADAGFKIISFLDQTDIATNWFREAQQQRARQQQSPTPPNPLNPVAILGPELAPAVANFACNVIEGRVRVVQLIAEKA